MHDLAPSPDTLVIVNCAGRTRSIIGAQSLVNAGIPNRVAALRNGTIGWTLAGFSLDRGRAETFGALTEGGLAKARASAKAWAGKVGVPVIDKATLDCYRAEAGKRTLYCFDVRSPEEFLAARPAGFVSAPGGQLVQATDEWVDGARRAHRSFRRRRRARAHDRLVARADGLGRGRRRRRAPRA